jgi:8-oxo-dGTP diphosphatase
MALRNSLDLSKTSVEKDDIYSIPIDAFFKSAFSVDCVIFGYHEKELKVLLIQRGTDPFEDYWALPGDLVYPYEDLDAAAARVLNDLTTLHEIPMRQVHAFGKVDRHPLGRVITVAYLALVEVQDIAPLASNWAKDAKWHSIKRIPKLAFDHKQILQECHKALKEIIVSEPIWTTVLPKKFTLTQFQEMFETILQREFDKGNFRKKINGVKFLKQLDEAQTNVRHRPSALYKFDPKLFKAYKEKGFVFEF